MTAKHTLIAPRPAPTAIELCAGADGQALGLHQAGFKHKLLIEIENPVCKTPRANNTMHSLGFEDMPLLTVRIATRIQGFLDWWEFYGKKTPAYRQVGNAFPPLVAKAIGTQIFKTLHR